MKVKNDHRSKFSNFKQLERRSLKKIRASTGFEPVTSVRDVIIFHCTRLSAQNQRVAYKLASQEYLGCTRDLPMPGPAPAPPIF